MKRAQSGLFAWQTVVQRFGELDVYVVVADGHRPTELASQIHLQGVHGPENALPHFDFQLAKLVASLWPVLDGTMQAELQRELVGERGEDPCGARLRKVAEVVTDHAQSLDVCELMAPQDNILVEAAGVLVVGVRLVHHRALLAVAGGYLIFDGRQHHVHHDVLSRGWSEAGIVAEPPDEIHEGWLVDQHGVRVQRAQVPGRPLSQCLVWRQGRGLHVLAAHGDLDEGLVGHGRGLVVGAVLHEVGDVDLVAKDGQRRAPDVAQQRVAGGHAQVVGPD